MSFTTAIDEANLSLLKWSVPVARVSNLGEKEHMLIFLEKRIITSAGTYLWLARQLAKEFIILKLGLLVGDDARHLKDEPRKLLKDGGRLKGQHRVAVGSLQDEWGSGEFGEFDEFNYEAEAYSFGRLKRVAVNEAHWIELRNKLN